MSRLKQFTRSMFSGYVAMAATIAYATISVPLALHYLTGAEFGLWALTTQLTSYLALIDLGMSGASRILIDYKDSKDDGRYGSAVQTTVYVSVVQGLMIAAGGLVLAQFVAGFLDIPPGLQDEFRNLVLASAIILALSFPTRIFIYVLTAHQRYDATNYAQVAALAVNLTVLWLAFSFGAGVYSVIWSQASAWLVNALITAGTCIHKKLLPPRGAMGRATWTSFKELFRFGQSIFLLMVGYQLVSASQTILLSRVLGLEAVSLWVVCTRVASFMTQFVFRIFDTSCAALAEMVVRGEADRLLIRFRDLLKLSLSIAVCFAAALVVCNQPFVQIWTGDKFSWSRSNDLLLAGVFLVSVVSHIHIGLIGQTKEFRGAQYIYVAEGIFFVLVSALLLPHAGIPALLGTSLVSGICFSGAYGIWRTSQRFHLPVRDVLFSWSRDSLRLAARLALISICIVVLTRHWPAELQLVTGSVTLGIASAFWLFRVGVPAGVQHEISTRVPPPLARLFGLPAR